MVSTLALTSEVMPLCGLVHIHAECLIFAYSYTMLMEAVQSSEAFVNLNRVFMRPFQKCCIL
jgi:hypothetical protein